MSETTDWIGAIGGALGGISIVWGWATSGKAAAAKAEADKAKTAADAAKVEAGKAIAEAAKATAEATKAIAKAEDAQTKAQVGTLELQLRANLSSRRDQIHEVTRDLEAIRAGRDAKDLTAADVERMKDAKLRLVSAHEDFLNGLEQACRHYRESKVDSGSFRLMYDREIRDVIECQKNSVFYDLVHPQGTTRFKAVWGVYEDWFNLEKKSNQ